MNSPAANAQLCEWILRKLEGTLPPEENEALIQQLKSSPDAVHLYNDIILLYSNLATPGRISLSPKTSPPSSKQLDALLFSMAEAEKDAPSLKIEFIPRHPKLSRHKTSLLKRQSQKSIPHHWSLRLYPLQQWH